MIYVVTVDIELEAETADSAEDYVFKTIDTATEDRDDLYFNISDVKTLGENPIING